MNQETEFKGFLESTLMRSSGEGRILDVFASKSEVFGKLTGVK